MAVAVDASMTAGNSADGFNQEATGATSISSTGITVGASATCLVGMCSWGKSNTNLITNPAMTWNSGSMTEQVEARSGTDGNPWAVSLISTVVNPASGALTLSCSWTTAQDCYMSAISFTGTDTSTGVQVADNTSATDTTTITVPSDTNGATVANFAVNGSTPTVNFTKIWAEAPLNPGGGGNYTLGGTSNAHTFTGAGGTRQALAGVHVIAGAGAAAVTGHDRGTMRGYARGYARGLG